MRDPGVWPQLRSVTLDHAILDALKQGIPARDLPAIYQAFAADLDRLSDELSAHVAAGHAEAARRAAHALAGTAAGVGATALEALARRAMHPGAPPVTQHEASAIAVATADAVAELMALGNG